MAGLIPVLFAAAVLAVLAFAWIVRDEGHLTAESGLGYWLGIAGTSIMVALLLYPMRKRLRLMRGLGAVGGWFRWHMVLGIIGPLLIVLHSNFKLGSLNSALAMATMLVVVASGIVGRYIYSKVHRGLYGSHLKLRDIADDLAALEDDLAAAIARDAQFSADLKALGDKVTSQPTTVGGALAAAIMNSVRITITGGRLRRRARKAVLEAARSQGWSRQERRARLAIVDESLLVYLAAARKAGGMALFERLLALWHLLHLPLFILLFLTATLHIIAVHLY